MNFAWPSGRKYVAQALILYVLFLLAIVGLEWGRANGLAAPLMWGLMAAPPLVALIQFSAAYKLIATQDEYVRGVTAKRFAVAAGATIALAVGWSVSSEYGSLPHAPAWLIYPLFWGVFGIVGSIIQDSRP